MVYLVPWLLHLILLFKMAPKHTAKGLPGILKHKKSVFFKENTYVR